MPYLNPVGVPYTGRWGYYPSGGRHRAVDFAVRSGTPVKAPAAGKVIVSGWSRTGFGWHVRIKMSNGNVIILAHLSKRAAFVGDWVRQGEVVGYTGTSGNSTGPHLHMEVRKSNWLMYTSFDFTPWMVMSLKPRIDVSECRIGKSNSYVKAYQKLLWAKATSTYKASWKAKGLYDFDRYGFTTHYGDATAKLTRDAYRRLGWTAATEPGPRLVRHLGGEPF